MVIRLVMGRSCNGICNGINEGGSWCAARPLRDGDFCYWHDPDHVEEAREARRLGGLRRKREGTIQDAYDFDGLTSIEHHQRLLMIAVVDLLSLENSVPRNRAIISAVMAGAKLLEVGDLVTCSPKTRPG